MNEVRRCDEMERKLRYLEKEIKKDGIPMTDSGESPEAPQPREMIDLEVLNEFPSFCRFNLNAKKDKFTFRLRLRSWKMNCVRLIKTQKH